MSDYVTKTNLLSALGRFKENTDDLYATDAELTDVKNALQATNKRVTNLEQKAGDEIVVDYPSPTYGMDEVPANVAEYGKVTKLRGVTRAWNNECPNGNFASVDGWSEFNTVTLSVSNNVCKVTSTMVSSQGINRFTDISLIGGHTYLLAFDIKAETSGHQFGASLNISTLSTNPIIPIAEMPTSWTRVAGMVQYGTTSDTGIHIAITTATAMSVGDFFSLKNVILRDLTPIFPEGVPSTIAECVAKCPDILKYDAYDAGSLVSTTYGGIKSYKTDSTELDTLSLPSPVELRSAGSVAETFDLESGEKTRPLRSVKMKTLTFGTSASPLISSTDLENIIKRPADNDTVANVLIAKYVVDSRNNITSKSMSFSVNYGGVIVFNDPNITSDMTSAQVQAYFGETELLFELATPDTDEQLTPILDPFLEVEGGGTIEPVQSQSIKIDHAFTAEYLSLGANA